MFEFFYKYIFTNFLAMSLLFYSALAHSQNSNVTGMAQGAQAAGGAQLGIASKNTVDSYGSCVEKAQGKSDKAKVHWQQCLALASNVMGILGAITGMMGNKDTENAVDTSGLDGLGSLSPGGAGLGGGTPYDFNGLGGSLDNIPSVDSSGPLTTACDNLGSLCHYNCNSSGENCTPSFAAPIDTGELLNGIGSGIANGSIDTDGLTPEEYLNQTADGLSQLETAFDELNSLAAGGDFSGGGGRALASHTPSDELTEDGELEDDLGLDSLSKNTQEKTASNNGPSLIDLDFDSLFGKKKKKRGPKKAVRSLKGHIYEKKTGKKLSLFDRMKRALRGKKNTRDLLLARHGLLLKKAMQITQLKKEQQLASKSPAHKKPPSPLKEKKELSIVKP